MLKNIFQRTFLRGRNKISNSPTDLVTQDMDPQFLSLYELYKKYTMTSIERMFALYCATRYVALNRVPGDIVECGVWKGGSAMLCASALLAEGERDRSLYLYDTYEGMTEPTDRDIDYLGKKAKDLWWKTGSKEAWEWTCASLEEVRINMESTGYPTERSIFIKGKVEETLPATIPEQIALLHLDTDWYESTYHEMIHLFPRLSRNGVILIDDYGHFLGAREAVDRYVAETGTPLLLVRVDYTGRVAIKTTGGISEGADK